MTDDSGAALVCGHIAKKNMPILRARRDKPLVEEDSGWQFLCNSGEDENEDDAQVWSINTVLGREPSLQEFINSPVGTVIYRISPDSPWKMESANLEMP